MSERITRVTSASHYESAYGFCRALRIGGRIMVAGTAPIPQDASDPPSSPAAQMSLCAGIARRAIDGLVEGGERATVVRTRMFITDAAHADEIGIAHGRAFGADRPVATMVVVAALLDELWHVEIEVEAVVSPARHDSHVAHEVSTIR